MALRVEPLGRRHRALVKTFRNQRASLTEYLRRWALRHAELGPRAWRGVGCDDLLSRTFVALDEVGGAPAIAGYFSLAPVSVARASVAPLAALDRLPRFPIPGVLLARLAIDQRVQGQGLGRFLFEEALGLTLQLARDGPIRFRLFVADAIDGDAAHFYDRFGLVRLGDGFPCRMVLDLAPVLSR